MIKYRSKGEDDNYRLTDRFLPILMIIALFALLAFIAMAFMANKTGTLSDRFFECCDSLIKLCVGAIVGAFGNIAVNLRKNSRRDVGDDMNNRREKRPNNDQNVNNKI